MTCLDVALPGLGVQLDLLDCQLCPSLRVHRPEHLHQSCRCVKHHRARRTLPKAPEPSSAPFCHFLGARMVSASLMGLGRDGSDRIGSICVE